ncbi:MAG: hypothetical protein R6X02_36220 [Enhygromyxa sp.]
MSKTKTNKKQLQDLYITELGQVTGGTSATTQAIGEEDPMTTQAIGEEDPYTTMAIGEEDPGEAI